MTPREFRELALALPFVVEGSHMGHADFRTGGAKGKIFATLSGDREERGMVKLPPAEQSSFLKDGGAAFQAGPGAWGRAGCTLIDLAPADRRIVKRALASAWKAAMPKQGKPSRQPAAKPSRRGRKKRA